MISLTAEYALRALIVLGTHPGQPMTTRQIAARTRVPLGYLAKVLQILSRAGLVEAQRGLHGGFVLSRPLDQVTILDVINVVDPLKRYQGCPLGLSAHRRCLCPLHRRLDEGLALLESLLGATTLGQLLTEPDASRSLCEDRSLCEELIPEPRQARR